VIGTALAIDLLALIVAMVAAALFFYSARIEEQNMTEAFPDAYPAYMARTKMLVPFVF
jgi:protein-S-isoprenylcysteine O-methyltransferase Ste14